MPVVRLKLGDAFHTLVVRIVSSGSDPSARGRVFVIPGALLSQFERKDFKVDEHQHLDALFSHEGQTTVQAAFVQTIHTFDSTRYPSDPDDDESEGSDEAGGGTPARPDDGGIDQPVDTPQGRQRTTPKRRPRRR